MSIDEFILFAEAILVSRSDSISTLCEQVKNTKAVYMENNHYTVTPMSSSAEADHYLYDSGVKSLLIPFIRSVIRSRYGLDDEVVKKYNTERAEREQKQQKKSELENSIAVMQWDLKQLYEEIKEEKQNKNFDKVEELNQQVADMNRQIKEAKNELYYLWFDELFVLFKLNLLLITFHSPTNRSGAAP